MIYECPYCGIWYPEKAEIRRHLEGRTVNDEISACKYVGAQNGTYVKTAKNNIWKEKTWIYLNKKKRD
jgi:hypothetical protein